MKITGNEPIAPTMYRQIGDNDYRIATTRDQIEGNFLSAYGGITIRQQFAMAAMQGMLAHATRYKPRDGASSNWHETISEESVQIADALIAALNKLER